MWSTFIPLALLVVPSLATVTPDNTCGGQNKYTCNPAGVSGVGGGCCSANGYCGSTPDYCGTGCQINFGQCFGQSSQPARKSGSIYTISGVGKFTNFANYTFTSGKMPSGLAYVVEQDNDEYLGPSGYQYQFTQSTVSISNGYLNLKVPGGQVQNAQGTNKINSAGVITAAGNIKYGSVRTYGILSNVSGTCQTSFFYANDTQEIDIEWLSDPKSLGYKNDTSGVIYPGRPFQYTNQPSVETDLQTHDFGNTTDPDGATIPKLFTAVHELRIDWIAGKTMFYFDGVLQKTLRHHVPVVEGYWLWQNWANGDPNWASGPPKTDSIFRISNIVMYYNTTS